MLTPQLLLQGDHCSSGSWKATQKVYEMLVQALCVGWGHQAVAVTSLRSPRHMNIAKVWVGTKLGGKTNKQTDTKQLSTSRVARSVLGDCTQSALTTPTLQGHVGDTSPALLCWQPQTPRESPPNAASQCKAIATPLHRQFTCQLFLEIKTSTCQVCKPATYGGLIKSSK